jgi:hypothetical protein
MRIGPAGSPVGPIESLTPYAYEAIIVSVDPDQREVALGASALNQNGTYAAIITDPIDVAPHMQQAVDSCCDYWLARIRGQKPDDAFTMYQRDLRLAFEQDQLAPLSGRSQEIWHDGGWKSPLKVDRG